MPRQRIGYVDNDTWDLIKRKVPIACVDFIPVRRASNGQISAVGLILRDTPFKGAPLWCHLGGRIDRGESLQQALDRHASETLGTAADIRFPADPVPLAAMEWFPSEINPDRKHLSPWSSKGEDPRQHAVSLCFLHNASPHMQVRADGEAIDFRWFTIGELDAAELWPGSKTLIYKVLAADISSNPEYSALLRTTYSTLAARALNHNTLMWQTPALALAAKAFLLTIALNPVATMTARLFAAGLNVMLSILCYQLLVKHREMMNLDRDEIVKLEKILGTPVFHARPRSNQFTWAARRSSGILWQNAFLVLTAVSLAIFVLSILRLGIYS